ncbi:MULTISPECIES: Zn-ribbon domain-containing protein [Methanococcoides]|jgi:predicted  nucleic acid-binding Zn-ribbon protein|uniref:Zn-ribbon domain-containing protein n=1 Tax=Methanococcoides seepicolus TaxID=2828780 RepID=A0A9E5DAJ6_9EURY|nr:MULTISPECIES: Zn-ribbon domain-containing protein [Methanococcoides]MCM1986785.1 Zn-ribbon domain-containing protein [Methanococcoides seepicolus]
MPHKCTRCEKIFEDGAEVILSGCPNCGWNKFLYVKDMEPEEEAKEKEVQVQPEIVDSVEEDIPAEQFIREIDDIIGIGHQRETVEKEEEGERVESVRILGPGSYELNLNSLFEREEIVMAIKQDGTYAVDLSSAFRKKKKKHN